MENLQLLNQFVDVVLYAWLTLVMFRRVVCRNIFLTPYSIYSRRKLIKNTLYYSDVLILLMSVITICILANELTFYTTGDIEGIHRTIPWMIYHKLLTIALLLRYKASQPKIFTEFINNIKEYANTNRFWKRQQ